MSKIKVLFEAGPMMDVRRTGVGYYVSHLFTNLAAYHGTDLELTGYYFDFLKHNHKQPPTIKHLAFHGVTLIPGKLLSLCRRLGFQPPLEAFVHRNTDLILYTNYVALPTLCRKPVALAIYDLSFIDHPEYIQSVNLAYLKRFCIPSIKRADVIITISEFTKSRLLHHFPDLTADIVITPIPPVKPTTGMNKHLPTRLTKLGLVPKKYILFVSTLEPRKNIQNLIAAYTTLPAVIRNEYPLVLAGGKGWKDEFIVSDIAAAQQQGHRIICPGYISDEEKHALYSNAACFVMPSHYEGFGMPVLEAIQYGLPVACSDIPAFREVASDAVVYFDKDDPDAIAKSLRTILSDEHLRKHLVKTSATLLNQYSWKRNTDEVYDTLTRLAKKRNSQNAGKDV